MGDEETLQVGLRALHPSPPAEGELVLVDGDVRITVRSRADSSSATVRLMSPYDANARGHAGAAAGGYRTEAALRAIRPMRISLRPETAGDREGKDSGLNAEVETGDPKFDNAVYVDTPTTDATVLTAVLNADVRAAVLDIFSLRVDLVVIDDHFGDVQIDLNGFPKLVNDADRARKLVEAFGRLARSVPRVTATGEKHPSAPWFGRIAIATVLAALGVPAVPIGVLYVAQMFGGTIGEGLSHLTLKQGDWPPRLVGFLGAFLFGMLSVALVRAFAVPKLGGRSDSRSRIRYLHIVLFLLFAEVGFLVGTMVGYATLFTY